MATTEDRRPYNARHVQIVDDGTIVTALWIPDPDHAKDPRKVLDGILRPEYRDVETVAEAIRYYKAEGATFSGWIVRSGHDHTEPIRNKREALKQMRIMIADYFTN